MSEERIAGGAGAEGVPAGQPTPSQETVAGSGEPQPQTPGKIDLSTSPEWRAAEAELQRQRDRARKEAESTRKELEALRDQSRMAALSRAHSGIVAEGVDPDKAAALLSELQQDVITLRMQRAKDDLLREFGLKEEDVADDEWGQSPAEARVNLAAKRRTMDTEALVKAAEARVAELDKQAKEREQADRRTTGAERLAGGEPISTATGLEAIRERMKAAVAKAQTGGEVRQLRAQYRNEASQKGLRPDW